MRKNLRGCLGRSHQHNTTRQDRQINSPPMITYQVATALGGAASIATIREAPDLRPGFLKRAHRRHSAVQVALGKIKYHEVGECDETAQSHLSVTR